MNKQPPIIMNNDFMSSVFEGIEERNSASSEDSVKEDRSRVKDRSSMNEVRSDVKDHRSIANDVTDDTSTQDNESDIDQLKRSVVHLIRNSVLEPPMKDTLTNQVQKMSSIPSIRHVENMVNRANK